MGKHTKMHDDEVEFSDRDDNNSVAFSDESAQFTERSSSVQFTEGSVVLSEKSVQFSEKSAPDTYDDALSDGDSCGGGGTVAPANLAEIMELGVRYTGYIASQRTPPVKLATAFDDLVFDDRPWSDRDNPNYGSSNKLWTSGLREALGDLKSKSKMCFMRTRRISHGAYTIVPLQSPEEPKYEVVLGGCPRARNTDLLRCALVIALRKATGVAVDEYRTVVRRPRNPDSHGGGGNRKEWAYYRVNVEPKDATQAMDADPNMSFVMAVADHTASISRNRTANWVSAASAATGAAPIAIDAMSTS